MVDADYPELRGPRGRDLRRRQPARDAPDSGHQSSIPPRRGRPHARRRQLPRRPSPAPWLPSTRIATPWSSGIASACIRCSTAARTSASGTRPQRAARRRAPPLFGRATRTCCATSSATVEGERQLLGHPPARLALPGVLDGDPVGLVQPSAGLGPLFPISYPLGAGLAPAIVGKKDSQTQRDMSAGFEKEKEVFG